MVSDDVDPPIPAGRTGAAGTLATRLDHDLNDAFEALRAFESADDLHRSEAFARVRQEVERVLGSVVTGEGNPPPAARTDWIRGVAWNIERGSSADGVIEALQRHPEMQASDLLFLSELDYGMARTDNRRVAEEIASALGFHYAYDPCFLNLAKGSGLEARARGENTQAVHGNALVSRYPLSDFHSIPMPNGRDKMRGKEKRIGCPRGLVATVDHPIGRVRVVVVHLDLHSSQRHRGDQMAAVLEAVDRMEGDLPVLIGGDFNTCTYNCTRPLVSILGYFRRLLTLGPDRVLRRHHPHPDRWFDRHLFRKLEEHGYRYRDLNEPGACTLHYDVEDLVANTGLADWVPRWCFWWIRYALRNHDGRCSMKLDWFAGRGVRAAADSAPRVLADVREAFGRLSDHDPILLDFVLE